MRFFETKLARREHFKRMLAEHPIGVPIPEPDDGDLRDLIELHPDAAEKIGVGVAYFFVQPNPPYNTRGFQICRSDGTQESFSYQACLNGRPSPLAEVSTAMRLEVGDDIQREKIEHFESNAADGRVLCPT